MAKRTQASQQKMVWHIYRFRERFELADDVRICRRGPLVYTKDYVGTGSDDESVAFARQMQALRGRRNYHHLRGVFHDLKDQAARTSRTYRGYLLDERFLPADEKTIARWLGLRVADCRAALSALADCHLLERVPCPKFDPTKNDDPPPSRARTEKSGPLYARNGKREREGNATLRVAGNRARETKKRKREPDPASALRACAGAKPRFGPKGLRRANRKKNRTPARSACITKAM